MDDKHELTEKLKVIETEIHNDKFDLRCINSKLEIAYKYEEELLVRMDNARKKTEELRKQFFAKSSELSSKFDKMKEMVNIFTGNWYNS